MDFQLKFDINNNIYLRNPESSNLGRQIIKVSIELIYELGFEHFTFKKLSLAINSTEASIYRYFENKHRLLLYIINWYWNYLEYMVNFKIQNITQSKEKLQIILKLLTHDLTKGMVKMDYDLRFLNAIVISESSKTYLVKEVRDINKNEVFMPYKNLCAKIAKVISDYNPKYKFPLSLSSTLLETSHNQQYFLKNLPRLTDVKTIKKKNYTEDFLEDLLFKILA